MISCSVVIESRSTLVRRWCWSMVREPLVELEAGKGMLRRHKELRDEGEDSFCMVGCSINMESLRSATHDTHFHLSPPCHAHVTSYRSRDQQESEWHEAWYPLGWVPASIPFLPDRELAISMSISPKGSTRSDDEFEHYAPAQTTVYSQEKVDLNGSSENVWKENSCAEGEFGAAIEAFPGKLGSRYVSSSVCIREDRM